MSLFATPLTLALLLGLFLLTTEASAQSSHTNALVRAATSAGVVSPTLRGIATGVQWSKEEHYGPGGYYGYYGSGGYRGVSGYKRYQLIWCEVCHLLRTRIVTRACSQSRGCSWSTSWIHTRACTRIKEYRLSAGYRYGEGGYHYGGGYSSPLAVHH
jgi:hypothetical protein